MGQLRSTFHQEALLQNDRLCCNLVEVSHLRHSINDEAQLLHSYVVAQVKATASFLLPLFVRAGAKSQGSWVKAPP